MEKRTERQNRANVYCPRSAAKRQTSACRPRFPISFASPPPDFVRNRPPLQSCEFPLPASHPPLASQRLFPFSAVSCESNPLRTPLDDISPLFFLFFYSFPSSSPFHLLRESSSNSCFHSPRFSRNSIPLSSFVFIRPSISKRSEKRISRNTCIITTTRRKGFICWKGRR